MKNISTKVQSSNKSSNSLFPWKRDRQVRSSIFAKWRNSSPNRRTILEHTKYKGKSPKFKGRKIKSGLYCVPAKYATYLASSNQSKK